MIAGIEKPKINKSSDLKNLCSSSDEENFDNLDNY